MADQSYRDILGRADAFFGEVISSQPQNLQCGRGCSLCCHGLFEISAADVDLVTDGLASLSSSRRKAIIRKAQDVIANNPHPDLRECSSEEKAAFYTRTSSVACPALTEGGECQIYESRPLVCRTFGLPLRNGEEFMSEVCELNFTAATDDERKAASWDLQLEDELGPDDEFTIPEAIVLAARQRGWL